MPYGRTVKWGKRVLVALGVHLIIMLVMWSDCCTPMPVSPLAQGLILPYIPVNKRDFASFNDYIMDTFSAQNYDESEIKWSDLFDYSIESDKILIINKTLNKRSKRSAKLSHISGTSRKIQIFIKKHFLQIFPDGTVNGTQDDMSEYTILQRSTVDIGQIRIQSVATCLYLCMDQCGNIYGAKTPTNDCVFNESMEEHFHNSYASTHHSNAKRTLYLALDRFGAPRKVIIPSNRPLGKLASYTKSLTQPVDHQLVDRLMAKLFGDSHTRHSLRQLCEVNSLIKGSLIKPKCVNNNNNNNNNNNASAKGIENSAKARKKKRKRRKCREDEPENEQCFKKKPTPDVPIPITQMKIVKNVSNKKLVSRKPGTINKVRAKLKTEIISTTTEKANPNEGMSSENVDDDEDLASNNHQHGLLMNFVDDDEDDDI